MENEWKLYIIQCGDGTLYTGITKDVDARFRAHQSGRGAKYTRGRGPLTLVYTEHCGMHSDALKREYAIKSMTSEEKRRLFEEK